MLIALYPPPKVGGFTARGDKNALLNTELKHITSYPHLGYHLFLLKDQHLVAYYEDTALISTCQIYVDDADLGTWMYVNYLLEKNYLF